MAELVEAKGIEAKGIEVKGIEAKGIKAKGIEAKGSEAEGHCTRLGIESERNRTCHGIEDHLEKIVKNLHHKYLSETNFGL